jgi:uncharacterized membrane protein
MKRFFDILNALLVLGMAGFALWGWSRIPDQIPVHFGFDGRPEAWAAKTAGSWFWVPGIGVVLALGIGWFRRMIPARPNWVNLPDRSRLSDFPQGARTPVIEMLSGSLALVQTEVLVIFALIQVGTYREAMGQESQWVILLVLLIAVLSSPFLLTVFFLQLQKALKRGRRLAGEALP